MCGQSINWDGMLDSRQVFKNASAESEDMYILSSSMSLHYLLYQFLYEQLSSYVCSPLIL